MPSLSSGQMKWDSKFLLICPLQEMPPLYKVTFSLERGWYIKRETTINITKKFLKVALNSHNPNPSYKNGGNTRVCKILMTNHIKWVIWYKSKN